jgi:hypothetical protein
MYCKPRTRRGQGFAVEWSNVWVDYTAGDGGQFTANLLTTALVRIEPFPASGPQWNSLMRFEDIVLLTSGHFLVTNDQDGDDFLAAHKLLRSANPDRSIHESFRQLLATQESPANINWRMSITRLLDYLKSLYRSAIISLILLQNDQARMDEEVFGSRTQRDERWERDSKEMWTEENDIGKAMGFDRLKEQFPDRETSDDISFQAEVRVYSQRWQQGRLPTAITGESALIHARAFVFSLASFREGLVALELEKNVPASVSASLVIYNGQFPDLKDIRDSAHHYVDRLRGLGRPKKGKHQPIPPNLHLAPGIVDAPPGLQGVCIIMDALMGDNYTCTVADGKACGLPVNEDSLTKMKDCLQFVLDSFRWFGRRGCYPSY